MNELNSHDPTQALPAGQVTAEELRQSYRPERIGRYRIERVLGSGGFGTVYLAHDEQLDRLVVVKVPHISLIHGPEDVQAYLAEARMVARIEHPGIVPVHDAGFTDECPCFIVSRYVSGTDLWTLLKQQRFNWIEAAELVARVAEALHAAHQEGVVHRDIKPGNILIDREGRPYVVDFGLALQEEDMGYGARYAGTPSYMSPEQARGEGHRVDGRSDIFSLGVVLYELLVGKKPFRAESHLEMLEQVTNRDPRPPRELDAQIPIELQRICLKAMAKRVSDRYSSASELADDLRELVAEQSENPQITWSGSRADDEQEAVDSTEDPTPLDSDAGPSTILDVRRHPGASKPRIVPKGLRSYDAHDAEFFLELLPGPRDRLGLPESIRFWKNRLEETDPANTFPVGVVYGPSGCGKTSFVRAGLLPGLSGRVLTVYVEATPDQTEDQLLAAIRQRFPDAARDRSLKDTLTELRRGVGRAANDKVVIVIDQFEQWLHAHRCHAGTELVHALRQCDGGRIQCLLLVRDDFWMAITRFMQELEVPLIETRNSAAVDLFPLKHAESVLERFGQALQTLPDDLSDSQRRFIRKAVAGLAQDGQVVCVRLALFAEMMKGRSWTPESLGRSGGTEGVGVRFLDETFSSPAAPPEHRRYAAAVRSVLTALLPEPGAMIRGRKRSSQELQELAELSNQSGDFAAVIRILDSELRLITPVDPEGVSEPSTESRPNGSERYYQLTHDYLIHSLRQWLTSKQCETRRGRAELNLDERTAMWSARPEPKQLPTAWEYLKIQLLTDSKRWTASERTMLKSATRFYGRRAFAWLLIGCVLTGIGWRFRNAAVEERRENSARIREQQQLNLGISLINRLMSAETRNVPSILAELNQLQTRPHELLVKSFQQSRDDEPAKLHLAMALTDVEPEMVSYLTQRLADLRGVERTVVLASLKPQAPAVERILWQLVEEPGIASDRRLRSALALASLNPDDVRWETLGPELASELAARIQPDSEFEQLTRLKHVLVAPLLQVIQDTGSGSKRRCNAVMTLAHLLEIDEQVAIGLPGRLISASLETQDPECFKRILSALRPHAFGVTEEMRAILQYSDVSVSPTEDVNDLMRQRLRAAVVLQNLGHSEDVWQRLAHSQDPTQRNLLIRELARFQSNPRVLLERLLVEPDPGVRQALILVLGGARQEADGDQRRRIIQQLLLIYRDDPDAGIHGAAAWSLDRMGLRSSVEAVDRELRTSPIAAFSDGRMWSVNSIGQTFVRVDAGGSIFVGDASRGEPGETVQLDHDFCIADREVTLDEYRLFRPDHQLDPRFSPMPRSQANMVSWYDAVAYCNWLSEREGLTPCYEPNPEGKFAAGMRVPEDFLQRDGYRLPLELEWECACRAGVNTAYGFGSGSELLPDNAWFAGNARNQTWPPGIKLPNRWGLFDMHGNTWEWGHELSNYSIRGDDRVVSNNLTRVLRGGAFDNAADRVEAGDRLHHLPHELKYSYGFRPVRTLP